MICNNCQSPLGHIEGCEKINDHLFDQLALNPDATDQWNKRQEDRMTHTPGPLQEVIEMHVDHDVTGYPVFYIHGFSGAQKFDEQALEQYRQQLVLRYKSHAALLEALKAVTQYWSNGKSFNPRKMDALVAAAKQAIKQAEGGASCAIPAAPAANTR